MVCCTLIGCGQPLPVVSPVLCESNSDCPQDTSVQLCVGKVCVQSTKTKDCSADKPCPTGQTCQNNVCVPDTNCKDGDTRECYTGKDGTQGVGTCKVGTQTCSNQKWSSCENETVPSKEICDGKDNDCDGTPDEDLNCSCKAGQTRECYSGDAQTKGVGECSAGTQTCKADNTWGECNGEKLPTKEVCDDNKDNDCNGRTDELASCKFVCTPGARENCYDGPSGTEMKGTCKGGFRICDANGKWGQCQEQRLPSKEICDGLDNDCNGKIDSQDGLNCGCTNGDTRACYTGPEKTAGVGACTKGTQVCANKVWGECKNEITPASAESCDGVDNDCDGKTDEDIPPKPCYTGPPGTENKGTCKGGQQTCVNGKFSQCTGQVLPSEDLCNGKDDNCDGQIDDKHTLKGKPCTEKLSNGCMSTGIWICTPKGKGTVCDAPQVSPGVEDCSNGKDDDCDGIIDNGAGCNPNKCKDGDTRPCFDANAKGCTQDSQGKWTCKGSCATGTQTCTSGAWGTCKGFTIETTESCNGKDDDCDGQTDENTNRSCSTKCGSGTEVCSGGTYLTCDAQQPQTEVCNGKDDNCDGNIDESITRPCTTKCGNGTETCKAGKWEACTAAQPQTEICNNKDDDCDGSIDNGLTRSCANGCGTGTETCSAGSWANCTAPKGVAETCNGKDDDCDGKIDNGLITKCPPFAKVQTSSFTMGSPSTEPNRNASREAQHQASFSSSHLYFSEYEVTCKQFKDIMGYDPCDKSACAGATAGNCPANKVSLSMAMAYANALSKAHQLTECHSCTGSGATVSCSIPDKSKYQACKGYRIPTEAEWEFAARAGETGAIYGTSLGNVCWYNSNTTRLKDVGTKQANKFGLYDVLGNVSEWTVETLELNRTSGTDLIYINSNSNDRVIRGCNYLTGKTNCRFADRSDVGKNTADSSIGIRLVRTP